MTADLAIVGGLVVADHVEPMTVLLRNGRVSALQEAHEHVDATTVLDASGMLVLPGAVDVHFHCRAPSYPHRGDFATESRAAAAGGVTTIFEMPISKPCTSTSERLRHRMGVAATKAHVNIGFYAAPGLLDVDDIRQMAMDGAVGFKLFTTRSVPEREDEFEGLATNGPAHILRVLEAIAPTGRRCVFHAEDQDLLDYFQAHVASLAIPPYRQHNASRPALIEAIAIAQIARLSHATGVPVHIAHVTSVAAIEAVREAKRAGAPLTAETCPQYLFCTEEDLKVAGPYGVINPPLRTADDRTALWEALADGTLDLVATDHAPFSSAEKAAATDDILSAPPGHPGVEYLVPLMMTAVAQGRLDVTRVVELISRRPAQLFGFFPAKGALAPGSDADVTIYDPRTVRTLRRGEGESRAADCNLLYDGKQVQGHVHATIVTGAVAYINGKIVAEPGSGRILRLGTPTSSAASEAPGRAQ